MNSFDLNIHPRDAQYGRFASAVLRTLKSAVFYRVSKGSKQSEIADRLEWHPSQLSRVLNGRVDNISIKTLSDILWACDFEPTEFSADAVEDISSNHHGFFERNPLPITGSISMSPTLTMFYDQTKIGTSNFTSQQFDKPAVYGA